MAKKIDPIIKLVEEGKIDFVIECMDEVDNSGMVRKFINDRKEEAALEQRIFEQQIDLLDEARCAMKGIEAEADSYADNDVKLTSEYAERCVKMAKNIEDIQRSRNESKAAFIGGLSSAIGLGLGAIGSFLLKRPTPQVITKFQDNATRVIKNIRFKRR